MKKIMYEKYAPISDDYSEETKALLAELLRKDPETRPSAKEILQKSFIAVPPSFI